MVNKSLRFEQGPIRPPNEARSFLLRVTRNCPWNQCLFCPVYKKRMFSLKSVDEIKQDILTAKKIEADITSLSRKLGFRGDINSPVISHIINKSKYGISYRNVAMWLYYKTGACFLQDADNLVMKTADLAEVLIFLRQQFPEIKRVTTYTRSRTIVRKSPESLKELKSAGLDRIHVGLESGYDPLLKLIKKGVTADQHVEAGRKVIDAGMELSEYVMPGLGGQEMWKEHAMATADVLNRINPHFIRLRSLRIPAGVPLSDKVKQGKFKMMTDDMFMAEIQLFIEKLEGVTSSVTSDHIMNLLEEVSGKLPGDKENMLKVIQKYEDLSDEDKTIYRIGRRGGAYRSTDDLINDSDTRKKIERVIRDVKNEKGEEGVEQFICEMADQNI